VQSQQLLTQSHVFEDEIFSGTESADNPSQEMSERHDYGRNHGQNLIETRSIRLIKSFILRGPGVLMRDRLGPCRQNYCAPQVWILAHEPQAMDKHRTLSGEGVLKKGPPGVRIPAEQRPTTAIGACNVETEHCITSP
jgi:hypothetical protein